MGRGAVRGQGLAVLILAGGRSRRMGQDKIWLPLGADGVPLIERVVARVRPLAGEFLFSANAPEPFDALVSSLHDQGVPAQVVPDRYPGAGPLAGLHAGLSAARCELLLAVAGDMPFINPALVAYLVAQMPGFDVAIPERPHPRTGEPVKEPLHAIYRRSCLARWRRGWPQASGRWWAFSPMCGSASSARMRSATLIPISGLSSM